MNKYEVRKIDLRECKTIDERNRAYESADVKVCVGLREVWDYCGLRLHRNRAGYSGVINGIEYVAVRVE